MYEKMKKKVVYIKYGGYFNISLGKIYEVDVENSWSYTIKNNTNDYYNYDKKFFVDIKTLRKDKLKKIEENE
jgi:hypothetical protein